MSEQENIKFGFASEPRRDGTYFIAPSTINQDNGKVTCHDVSGFAGSWDMAEGGVFFPEEGGGSLCSAALDKAQNHADNENKKQG